MEERKYLTTEELKRLQGILLEMILEVDRICTKYKIPYCLGGGTLLGAVRYQGFIPWDDDADLFFLRKDYERFRKAAKKELDSRYFYQDYVSDPYSHYVQAKIRRNDSIFVTGFGEQQTHMHQGIFLDIFVHDRTANHPLFQKLHILQTRICRAMLVATWSGKQYTRRPKLLYACINAWIRHSKVQVWDRRTKRVLTKYRNKKDARYSYDGTGEHLSHGVFPIAWITKTKRIPFEGHMLPAPIETEKYLTYSYDANYMTPPPVSKRYSNHAIVKLKFPEE